MSNTLKELPVHKTPSYFCKSFKVGNSSLLSAGNTEFTVAEADALKQTDCWGEIYELVKEDEGVTQIVKRDVNTFIPKRKTSIELFGDK